MSTKGHVLLGMSGGIDSSVAAILLKENGYKVTGLTLRTYDYVSAACLEKQSGCCTVDSIFDAKELMKSLAFEHHVLDVRKDFNKFIIKNFIDEYISARTPNPCVICNSLIKWPFMINKADELGCDYIATGHYARLRSENNRFVLSAGDDETKDQSYFLWRLKQSQLARTLFPLGNYKKSEIRNIASNNGLSKLVKKRESQEICFISNNNYRTFLKENIRDFSEKYKPGNIILSGGKVAGLHKGYPFYTIGQRKGLEVAAGYPLYVKEINPIKNEIILAPYEELARRELFAEDINFIKYAVIPDQMNVRTKIRYRSKAIHSIISLSENKIHFTFDEDVYYIAPGQSVVFYEGKDIIGGGIISN